MVEELRNYFVAGGQTNRGNNVWLGDVVVNDDGGAGQFCRTRVRLACGCQLTASEDSEAGDGQGARIAAKHPRTWRKRG